ncbi:MAG: PAS domain S-box protein [Actinobacteria bacterium]|nr:MAG: PAS domain S-box protein [Actinomycetota bacterium]
MWRPDLRTAQLLLSAAVALLLAAAIVAAFVEDRWTRVAILAPIAVALACASWLAIARWHRVRRARDGAEGRVEDVRTEGEAKFRALAENVPGITWLTHDRDRRSLLYISPRVEQLLGYTPREWEAEPDLYSNLLHPDDRERVLAELEATPSNGRPRSSAYRLVARDGRIVGIRENTSIVRDAAGKPLYTQTILLDDAERRRADEERERLRGAERTVAAHNVALQARLDLLRDVTEVLASSVDARMPLQRISDLLVRDFADWLTLDTAEDDKLVRTAAAAAARRTHPSSEPGDGSRNVLQSGQPLLIMSSAENGAHGTEFPEDTSSLVSVPIRARGRALGVLTLGRVTPAPPYGADDVALAEDLAARIGIAIDRDRLYREVEERADAGRVLTYVADGVLLVDREGIARLWNPAAEKITGIPATDLVGHAAAERIGGWRDALDSVPVSSSPDPGHPEVIVPIVGVDGERWISISGVHFFYGTVYAFRDVTEVRQLEELKADFIATASHELRTPLAAVYGAAQTLLRHDFALDEAGRDRFVSLIADESDRLGRIVNEILLANQLDAGRVDLGSEAFEPGELIERVVDAARVHAPPNVVIDRTVPAGVPQVAADRDKVRQVLVNLVENAIKYSPGGGRIEVGIEVGAEAEADMVTFFVRDEGLGIPTDEQARIFEKFYRLDPHMTRGVGGTGLGLYICNELVNRMGGHIWVDSSEGKGSTFLLSLPTEPKVPARQLPRASRSPAESDR